MSIQVVPIIMAYTVAMYGLLDCQLLSCVGYL